MKFLIILLFFLSSVSFASDRSEVDKNLKLLLERTRQNAKYHFCKKRKGHPLSKYERLIMENKPSFEELVNELNIYKDVKRRNGQ